ncbi:MAG: bifunctional 4-hydroxy-2-oxoglutarate aldolase/2-dehydro-3-deoxy-phosphogluconate aldolase [Planctomycetota bacterium]|jgi:Entner-Doudoroff aldolase
MRPKDESLEMIQRERLSAIIRTDDESLARNAMNAAVEGGFRLVEFTMTTPGALSLMAEFAAKDGLLVGAGTVMTSAMAADAVQAGARFIVSPIYDVEVVKAADRLDAVSIPGAQTPTEMEIACRGGADLIKLFPAPAGGIEYVRAIRGPMPHLKIFPTAGVDEANFTDFLDAGCVGAGFVRSLFVPADLQEENFDAISQRARRIITGLRAWEAVNASKG